MSDDEARKNPALRATVQALLGADFGVRHLDSGDFAAFDTPLTLGIEHKTFPNLVSSMYSNELDRQLSLLIETYDVRVLLIDGFPTPRYDGRVAVWGSKAKPVPYALLLGVLSGWYARGIWPLMVESYGALAPTVAELYRFCGKKEHRASYNPNPPLPALRRASFVEALLLGFPGIGEKRAREIAQLGMSAAQLAGLTELQWVKLLGPALGRKVAARWTAP